jgi:hypothetical protein
MRLSFGDMITGLRRDFFGWRGTQRPRPVALPQAPAVRMSMKPGLRAAAWYPAKAPDGSPQMQIVVDLACGNKTSSAVRVIAARLGNHAAEQTILLVGLPDGQLVAASRPIPPNGKAQVRITFFVKGRPHPPGEWFNEYVILTDHKKGEHRLKVAVRGH